MVACAHGALAYRASAAAGKEELSCRQHTAVKGKYI
jgi:hypothetical protein